MVHRLTAEDKEFRAQQDLRTLQDAETIKRSGARLGAAKKMAETSMAAVKGAGTRKKATTSKKR